MRDHRRAIPWSAPLFASAAGHRVGPGRPLKLETRRSATAGGLDPYLSLGALDRAVPAGTICEGAVHKHDRGLGDQGSSLQRSDPKAALISSEKIWGSSHDAKCPPFSASLK
jgi:hypothetical protein